jgi:MoxR-like ATPase
MNILNKLHFYFKNQKNVLLSGPHGVGKTSIVKEVFESNGLIMGQDCLIFSAATMDPWTDLIGIPYPVKSNDETEVKYLKPSHIDESRIQAIFFDEYNRSHKKIRNAVMELIQFKSINGRKFENLKVVTIRPSTKRQIPRSYKT